MSPPVLAIGVLANGVMFAADAATVANGDSALILPLLATIVTSVTSVVIALITAVLTYKLATGQRRLDNRVAGVDARVAVVATKVDGLTSNLVEASKTAAAGEATIAERERADTAAALAAASRAEGAAAERASAASPAVAAAVANGGVVVTPPELGTVRVVQDPDDPAVRVTQEPVADPPAGPV